MTEKQVIKISKFLSLILRHHPEQVGLQLDEAGWVSVEALLWAVNRHGVALHLEQLRLIVATNDKKRFAFSEDGLRIRASQGHSLAVDLQYEPQAPPEVLYHGTARHLLEAIRRKGLQKMRRHHVHLSPDSQTAAKVGSRHGKVVVLIVRAGEMHRAGHRFYHSANGVWLVDHVPPAFIDLAPHC